MRILILGASSYIGKRLKKTLENDYEYVYGTYRTEVESFVRESFMYRYCLGEDGVLQKILSQTLPDTVITCLRGDFSLQLDAYKIVAEYLSKKKSGKFIFLSTSNVFDAALEREHSEGDIPKSDSDYGNFKIQCEQEMQDMLGKNAIIIRIPEVWGKDCPRLKKLISDIKAGNQVITYENLFINITTDAQMAEWILYIIQHNLDGIFHVGTKDMYEYIRFHRELIATLHKKEPVFQVINCGPGKETLAAIPGRSEIPQSMQIFIKEVIQYLGSSC